MNRYKIFSEKFFIPEDGRFDFAPVSIQSFPDSVNDLFVEIKRTEQYAPDLIAFNYYGDERLYWVILMANDIMDPFTELYAGRTIRIPDILYLQMMNSIT